MRPSRDLRSALEKFANSVRIEALVLANLDVGQTLDALATARTGVFVDPVPRQNCVRSIMIDVGVAGRHSTGDASRHQEGCAPIGWCDASRPLLEILAL